MNLTSEFTSDFSQNPVLLYMLTKEREGTVNPLDVDEHINTAWPTELFPNIEAFKKDYGELPYIRRQLTFEEDWKENEWLKLVGADFYSLSEEKRQFLLQTAGVIKFEQKVDIKKLYDTSIY